MNNIHRIFTLPPITKLIDKYNNHSTVFEVALIIDTAIKMEPKEADDWLERFVELEPSKGDIRAALIGKYLQSGKMSQDATKRLAYTIRKAEVQGNLETFISEEIDEVE